MEGGREEDCFSLALNHKTIDGFGIKRCVPLIQIKPVLSKGQFPLSITWQVLCRHLMQHLQGLKDTKLELG